MRRILKDRRFWVVVLVAVFLYAFVFGIPYLYFCHAALVPGGTESHCHFLTNYHIH